MAIKGFQIVQMVALMCYYHNKEFLAMPSNIRIHLTNTLAYYGAKSRMAAKLLLLLKGSF
jgi:hypothetical protein